MNALERKVADRLEKLLAAVPTDRSPEMRYDAEDQRMGSARWLAEHLAPQVAAALWAAAGGSHPEWQEADLEDGAIQNALEKLRRARSRS